MPPRVRSRGSYSVSDSSCVDKTSTQFAISHTSGVSWSPSEWDSLYSLHVIDPAIAWLRAHQITSEAAWITASLLTDSRADVNAGVIPTASDRSLSRGA